MNELTHYGVLGMKWGVRRYQNKDGTLTAAGKRRYQNKDGTLTAEGLKRERRKIDRKIKKDSKQIHRQNDPRWANRRKVLNAYNRDRMANQDLSEKWNKAFKAGKGSPEWAAWEAASKEHSMKFAKQYVDAFLKDVGLTKVSDIGKQYTQDKLYSFEWMKN
ncbi:MAG TPA: hypothetical protein GX717_00570 [Clostridiaceae bacterium]|nr:hypothetical protein [Clostridiaceae bacterium]